MPKVMDLMDVDNPEEFRCLSLCTGYAGIELGIRRVVPNLRTVAYVEIEAFACANLVGKMEAGLLDAAPVWTDIKTFNGKPFYKRIHIITAGYPCQGESHAGKRRGQSDPRWLWPYIERIIEAVQPVWFFGENVRGHLSLGFPTVYRSLRLMGYKVESGLFSAAECGAPHQRCRLFILAYRSDSGLQAMPIQQTRQPTFRQSCEDLADTTAQRIQRPEPEGAAQARRRADKQSNEYLADTENPNRGRPAETINARRRNQEIRGQDLWPSRPGQPQYEWEEPRVVDHAQHRRHEHQKGQIRTRGDRVKHTDEGQTKSRLGGAANGTACRVDRLRLLGNGVVPQQAEKAFRYLIEANR